MNQTEKAIAVLLFFSLQFQLIFLQNDVQDIKDKYEAVLQKSWEFRNEMDEHHLESK